MGAEEEQLTDEVKVEAKRSANWDDRDLEKEHLTEREPVPQEVEEAKRQDGLGEFQKAEEESSSVEKETKEEQQLQQDTARVEEEDPTPQPTVVSNDDTAKLPHGQTRTSLFSDDSIEDTSVDHRQ